MQHLILENDIYSVRPAILLWMGNPAVDTPQLYCFKSFLSDAHEGDDDAYGHCAESNIENYIQVCSNSLTFGRLLGNIILKDFISII